MRSTVRRPSCPELRASLLPVLLLLLSCTAAWAHSPHDMIDLVELSPDYATDQTLFVYLKNINELRRSTDGGRSWKSLVTGLHNVSHVTSIAVSPCFSEDAVLYMATDRDGLFRSEDGGLSWTVLANAGMQPMNRMVVFPRCEGGTHALFGAGAQGGLYRLSTDAPGWELLDGVESQVSALVFATTGDGVIGLAGDVDGNLYLSEDEGRSWERRNGIEDGGAITAIAPSPSFGADDSVFIGTQRQGVQLTTDAAASFGPVGEGLPGSAYITSVAVSPGFQDDETVFASTWRNGVYRSRSAGKVWEDASVGLSADIQADGMRAPHYLHLRLSERFPQDGTLFLGAFDGLFQSTDGADTWDELTTRAIRSEALAVSPAFDEDSMVAIVTYHGGAYLSQDGGASWKVSNVGLNKVRLTDVAFSPGFKEDHAIFISHHEFIYRSTDYGETWDRHYSVPLEADNTLGAKLKRWFEGVVSGNDEPWRLRAPMITVMAMSPAFARDQTMFFGTRYTGVYRSTDGGLTFQRLRASGVKGVNSVVLSPGYPQDRTLFASSLERGVQRSEDGGETWIPANAGLPKNDGSYNFVIRPWGLTISPRFSEDSTLFVGTPEGLYKSEDAGEEWRKIGRGVFGERAFVTVASLSPDYGNDRTLLMGVKGRGLFKSIDGGGSFVPVGPSLTAGNHQIDRIVFSPAFREDRTILAASTEGLFKSTDAGESWVGLDRPIRYEDDKTFLVRYQGSWERSQGADYSGFYVTSSEAAGDAAVVDFVGTGIGFIGTRGPDQGIAKIYLDGNPVATIDQFATERRVLEGLYAVSDLAMGPHRLTVEVAGSASEDASGHRVEIDAFDVVFDGAPDTHRHDAAVEGERSPPVH